MGKFYLLYLYIRKPYLSQKPTYCIRGIWKNRNSAITGIYISLLIFIYR